jgi:hypothetical protein
MGQSTGQTLFMIYIDHFEMELDKLEPEVKLIKFADDTKGRKVTLRAWKTETNSKEP